MFDDVITSGSALAAGSEADWSSEQLTELAARLGELDLDVPDSERIDQLSALEKVKAACAAAQARITDRFVDSQAELARQWRDQARACSDASDFDGWCAAREQARRHEFTPATDAHRGDDGGHGEGGGSDRASGRSSAGTRRARNPRAGVAAQVALARRESPAKGTRIVSTALALTRHLPHTLAALSAGRLNEHRACLVARHTSHLSAELAATVDAQVIGAHPETVGTWGDRELERHVRACADRLDAAAATERARTAESDRRVTLRPIPDTMALLTAVLPVAQAVAVHAALARAAATAKAAGDPRSTGQLMADTLVALVTGQRAATDIPIEVQVIITDRALFGGDDTAAHIPGYGPVPAAWVRHLLTPDGLTPDDLSADEPDTDDTDRTGTEHPPEGEADCDDSGDLLAPNDLDTLGDLLDAANDLDDLGDLLDAANDLDDTDAGDLMHDSDGAQPDPPPLRPPPPEPGAVAPPAASPRQSRRAHTWLRRLYTDPGTGTLVTMDSRRRLFDAGLRRYLIARDGVCRTPWCDAPIRHLDHIQPHAEGGPTTAANGQGLCVRCNLVKDLPGFHARVIHPGFHARVTHPGPVADGTPVGHPGDNPGSSDRIDSIDREPSRALPHTVQLTTPTGHTYTSLAPPVLPGPGTPPEPTHDQGRLEPAPALAGGSYGRGIVIDLRSWHRSPLETEIERHLAG